MPRHCKKGWLRTYVEYTANQESPEIYHLWSGVSQIVATLCRNVYVDFEYFQIYPNMYMVMVGPTGVGKSTATDIGVGLYQKAFPKTLITRGKISVAKLIQDMGDEYQLHGTSRAFVYAPEFKVFTAAMSTNTSLVEDLTDLYSCPNTWSYRTKNRGVVSLENVCINILGASIPEWLCTTSGEDFINTGFAARILYIGARTSDRSFHKPRKPAGADAMEDSLIRDLIDMSKMKGKYEITPAADKFHEAWYKVAKSQETLQKQPDKMHGYIMRKDAHMLKVAMALKASKSDDLVLEEDDLRVAVRMLESIEEGMLVAYQSIAFSSIEAAVEKILQLLKGSKSGFLTHRDIMRRTLGFKGLGGRALDEVIEYMVKADMLAAESRPKGSVAFRIKMPEEVQYGEQETKDRQGESATARAIRPPQEGA